MNRGTTGRPAPKKRGSAVLAVLWVSVILGFMALALASTVRTEVEAAGNFTGAEQGLFLARAGFEAAILHLTTPQPQPEKEWGRRELAFEFETGTARIEIRPATSYLNLNTAPPELLARLLENLNLPPGTAAQHARRIEELRTPPGGRPFSRLEELLGMEAITADLFYGTYAAPGLVDLLTVRDGSSGTAVNPNYAHLRLLEIMPGLGGDLALAMDAQRKSAPIRRLEGAAARSLTLNSTAVLTLTAYGRAQGSPLDRVVRAVVELDASQPLGYRLLEWNDRL